MFNERARIGAFVLAKKLPTLVSVAEMVPYGALLSYGPDFPGRLPARRWLCRQHS